LKGGVWSNKVSKSMSLNHGCFLISVASVSLGSVLWEPRRFFWSQIKERIKLFPLLETSGAFGICSDLFQLIILYFVVALSFEQNGGYPFIIIVIYIYK